MSSGPTALAFERSQHLDALRDGAVYDVLVVGGGATGLGVAVDAAARGYRTALVERHDFAKGTSSRSTKLVHGGVRYLRQGNVALVLEALRERGRLSANAPHLVHDLAFVIPVYRWWEGPFYGIGMKVYDGLAGKLGLAPSRWLSREETIERIPTIETDGLDGGVVYHDGQFDDARMAIHLAMTAAEHGAHVVNYCACLGLTKSEGRVSGAHLRDEESGEDFKVEAKCVVNATGVWVDDLRKRDDDTSRPIVAVSQGVHLVLPRRFLPGNSAVMVPRTSDGRVLFAVPWHDRVVLGTTDTPVEHASLEPRPLAEEQAFLISHARDYLSIDPNPSDVLSQFAGLRPLVKGEEGASTAELSRGHSILVSPSGLITVTGGKWTTYRKMAEEVVDHVELVGGLPERRCLTVDLKLHGAMDDCFDVYGSDRAALREVERARDGGKNRLHERLLLTEGEVIWQVRHEMARTVEDVLARRSRALLLDAVAAIECAPRVAQLIAEERTLNDAWAAAETDAFRQVAAGYLFA